MNRRPLRTLGRYDLIEELGQGGAAIVYLAYQRDLRRDVALKQLAPFQAGDPASAARFVEESYLAGSLGHPNIVTVHEYFEHEGVPYIAMEYLPRGSLRKYLGALSIAQVAGVVEGVLAGLSHGQTRGVVHRDLKPENLLVTSDGRIKIADFGIATTINSVVSRVVLTAAGTTIGTPAYMAPEQAQGQELGPGTDLYSLGIVAFEMLTGRVPFEDTGSAIAVLYRQVHEAVPPARSLNPQIDAGLDEWLARMLAKRPDDRFPSADAAWEAMEDIVLRLLGPRWRREARLTVGSPATSPAGQPLTPAPFGQTEHPDAPPRTPPEASGEPASDPVVEPQTVAPRLGSAPAGPTVHRIARRHASREAASDPPARDGPRRGVVLAAVLLAVTGGAAVGGVVGSKRSAPQPRPATTSAAVRAAQSRLLLAALQAVATSRAQGLTKLSVARNGRDQAAAATVIAQAYRAGVQQIDGLAAAVRASAPALSLRSTLDALAAAYAALSAAAASADRAGYRSATTTIATAEQQLRAQGAALAKGA